jgi:large subunit ribosomal protein L17
MRHKMAGRKLGRNPSHRRAMLRNLVTSLLEHERLVTTLPKAKEVRPLVEKMITLGKRDTLHARRQVKAYLLSADVARKVFDTIAPRFSDRPGGYSRIIRYRNRVGDGAEEAIIELLDSGLEDAHAERETQEAADTSSDRTEESGSTEQAEASAESAESTDADDEAKEKA